MMDPLVYKLEDPKKNLANEVIFFFTRLQGSVIAMSIFRIQQKANLAFCVIVIEKCGCEI